MSSPARVLELVLALVAWGATMLIARAWARWHHRRHVEALRASLPLELEPDRLDPQRAFWEKLRESPGGRVTCEHMHARGAMGLCFPCWKVARRESGRPLPDPTGGKTRPPGGSGPPDAA